MGSLIMLESMFDDVKRMDKRQFLYQVLSFGMIVSSALMIWKGLMGVTGSESPIVVVLSGSMEPAFQRGDLLFLTNYEEEDIRVGEIVVFKIDGRDIPIVHRSLYFNSCEDCLHLFLQGFEAAREGGWVHQVPDQGRQQQCGRQGALCAWTT